MYLYLLKCEGYETTYKIGKSKNVITRRKTLQTGNPVRIQVLHKRRFTDVFAVESFLHYLFDSRRIIHVCKKTGKREKSEWFRLTPLQVIWIEGRIFRKRSLKYTLYFWLSDSIYLGRGL